MTEKKITFYVTSEWREPKEGMKFITDELGNVSEIADKFKYDSSKVYVEDEEGTPLLLKEYLNKLREGGIENVSFFWSFLEKVKKSVKKTGNKNAIVDVFKEYSPEDRKELDRLYWAIDNKLTNVLDDKIEEYGDKNPSFYLSEDGMMDLIPYLITLGEKRVATFMKKPHLALKLSQQDYEYPFNLLDIFLTLTEGVE